MEKKDEQKKILEKQKTVLKELEKREFKKKNAPKKILEKQKVADKKVLKPKQENKE